MSLGGLNFNGKLLHICLATLIGITYSEKGKYIHFNAELCSIEVSSAVCSETMKPVLNSFTHFSLHWLWAVIKGSVHLEMMFGRLKYLGIVPQMPTVKVNCNE